MVTHVATKTFAICQQQYQQNFHQRVQQLKRDLLLSKQQNHIMLGQWQAFAAVFGNDTDFGSLMNNHS